MFAPEAFAIWCRDCTIRQSPRCEAGMWPLGTIWGAGRPLNRRRCSNRRARIAERVRRGSSTETMPTVPPATGATVVKRMFDTSVPFPGTCQESRIFVLQRTTRQMLSAASPAAPEGAGKQKTPRRASAKRLILLRLSGAGEGIRTLDPNLGNRSGSFSLPQVVARHNTKNPYVSSAYLDRPAAGATLENPKISGHLLPPCFPGHAAPAWGSKSARPRAPPIPQAIDHEEEIAKTGAPICRN